MRSASSPSAVNMITGTSERARYPAAELEPVHARHHQVQDDRGRASSPPAALERQAVLSFEGLKPAFSRLLDDNVADDRLVVDDKDATHRTIIDIGCYSR